MIGCKECPDLKKWYHGPNSHFGMISYSCARTGYIIDDPEQIARVCPMCSAPEVIPNGQT